MKYFEGFYVKCAGKNDDLAVIFGRQTCDSDRSSFIQIITKDKSYGATYQNQPSTFSYKPFKTMVGDSFCDEAGLVLDINTHDLNAKGFVSFSDFTPIKYDAMGPLKLLPKMECKHTVISMQHKIEGKIALNGQIYDFSKGTGYIEGDRGKSFPSEYFWSQASDKKSGACLFASAAKIPYLGFSFMGTICIANFEGKEHRFASYLGAKVKQINDKKLLIRQGKKTLEIEVLDDKQGLDLKAPNLGQMSRVIKESLDRKVKYKMAVGDNTLFEFSTDRGAVEYSCLENKNIQQ